MAKPTADWERVSDRFYRKTQLYTSVFDPDLELENYVVVEAPYSGAVGRHIAHTFAIRADNLQLCTAMNRKSTPIEAPLPPNPPSTFTLALEN